MKQLAGQKNKCDEYFDNGNIPLNHTMEINLPSWFLFLCTNEMKVDNVW